MLHRRDALTKVCTVLFTAALIAGLVGTVSRAAAVWEEVTETGRPGLLRLSTATATPMWASLSPGDTTHWLVAATLLTAPKGNLQLELTGSGSLIEAGDPSLSVTGCPSGFSMDGSVPTCSSGGEPVLPETRLASVVSDDRLISLDEIVRGEPRELLVTLTLPESASATEVTGKVVHVGLGLHAAGDGPPAEPGPVDAPPLPLTGSDAWPLLLLAVGLIGGAACMHASRRARAGAGADASRPALGPDDLARARMSP